MTPEQAAALRAPFPQSAIGKLPRISCSACSKAPSKNCDKHAKAKCAVCENWITSAHIHLDYVGHAAVTSRLLEVDPEWHWEPMAFAESGEPRIVSTGTDSWLWIRLTVAGVERIGVGTAPTNSFELPKQLISDAIRSASMRFGVALDLWSKEEIGETPASDSRERPAPSGGPVARRPVARSRSRRRG